MTSDAPGTPMQPGSAGTASSGYRVPAPRSPQPLEATAAAVDAARRKRTDVNEESTDA